MTIPPHKYDFIWKVDGFILPFATLWMTPEVTRHDFITTYTGNSWRTYLGKNDRKRLSDRGYRLLTTSYTAYHRRLLTAIHNGTRTHQNLAKLHLPSISDTKLRAAFNEYIRSTQALWRPYFWTEYFAYDRVEQVLKRGNNPTLQQHVREIQKLKLRLRTVLNESGFGRGIGKQLIHEIARRGRVVHPEWYTHQELRALLGTHTPQVPNRSRYITGKYNNWKLVVGRDAERMISLLEKTHLRVATLLTGQVANTGRYRGRVRIIPFDVGATLTRHISAMKKGEVLVTGSTGPEMILACKKAGAIVTEEGGITSHAAIISRELGIPCVIGTKIATEVLRNGDYIEVDAINGIVRKLK